MIYWRYTLSHETLGSLVISEPDGWEDGSLRKERDKKFHSLSKYFNGSFIFYGDTGSSNGGYAFLKAADTIGVDEIVGFKVEYSKDNINFIVAFDGQVDLETKVETPDGRMRATIIRNDLWSKFLSRFTTPVNLLSPTDQDGGTRTIYTPCSLVSKTQIIRYNGSYYQKYSTIYDPDPDSDDGDFQLGFNEKIIDDLNKYYVQEHPISTGPDSFTEFDNSQLLALIEAPFDGKYTFELGSESASYFVLSGYVANPTSIYIRKVSDTSVMPDVIHLIPSTSVSYGPNEVRVHEGSITLDLFKGEQVTVFANMNSSGGEGVIFFGRVRKNWKPDVDLATTTAIVLSGEQTIDGITTSSSRILVKDQGNFYQNGIYVTSAGPWSRASDSDTADELVNSAVYVTGGTNNGDSYYLQINEELTNLGVDPITWSLTDYDFEKEIPYPGSGEPISYLRVTADTTFPTSFTTSFLIHDAALSISDRIIGKNVSLYAPVLGSNLTAIAYPSNGCYWSYILAKGLQFRGYDVDVKPVSMSMSEWWDGIDPILNLGLGTRVIDGDEKIYIGKKEEFYDDSSTSVDFYNLMFETSYDEDLNFNKITIGFETWKSESVSGIDDPQTNHVYASRFKRTGKEITIQSKFIAASTAMEFTRRQSLEKTTDYKFDDNTFIVAINPIPSEELYPIPATYIPFFPEFDESFDSVTGLHSPQAKYNLRLTPARNLLRWLPYINAGLQSYLGSEYKFQSGEGNYDMESEMSIFDCDPAKFEGLPLSEKQNIPVTDITISVSMRSRDISIPMTIDEFMAMDAEPEKAIGISQTDANPVKFFVDVFDYSFAKGSAVVTGWFKELYNLNLATGSISQPICFGRFDAPCGDDAILSEEGDFMLSEDGECIVME